LIHPHVQKSVPGNPLQIKTVASPVSSALAAFEYIMTMAFGLAVLVSRMSAEVALVRRSMASGDGSRRPSGPAL